MAVQLSVAVRNAQLAALEPAVGTSAVLQLRTGSPPASCAAANTGTVVASLPLPSDWMAAPSNGTVGLSGSWSASASASNTVGHFRLFDNAQTTCHMQGTVTNTGGGGDLTLDNVIINSGQLVTITAFNLTAGNA